MMALALVVRSEGEVGAVGAMCHLGPILGHFGAIWAMLGCRVAKVSQ
jgi:hypothetical protein